MEGRRLQRVSLYRTPHIDALAEQGTVFTHAYAIAPVCSPTRASILTGLQPARYNLTGAIKANRESMRENKRRYSPVEHADHLPRDIPTIAGELAEAATGPGSSASGTWGTPRTAR